jgi:histidine ammonia-lyase
MARVAELTRLVLGMEYLAATQGIEFHRPLRTSDRLEAAVSRLRERVPRLDDDRVMSGDMEIAADLIPGLSEI